MVHRVVFRVASDEALTFWEERLTSNGVDVACPATRSYSTTRRASASSCARPTRATSRWSREHPEIPRDMAIQGFDGVRAYSADPERSRNLLEETLGFSPTGDASWECRGDRRGGFYVFDQSTERGLQGAGTVHHVAWADEMDDHEAWQQRVAGSEAHPTPIIDRFWFLSIYFREPSGVLFEIATLGPGFATDEDPEHLGEKLVLPPRFEPLREQVERTVTPIHNPREDWSKAD